jgi:hypothetical protein
MDSSNDQSLRGLRWDSAPVRQVWNFYIYSIISDENLGAVVVMILW